MRPQFWGKHVKTMSLRRAAKPHRKPGRRRMRLPLRAAATTLSAAAALLLAPVVVVLPAQADAGLKVGPGVQPLGIAEGPDGTLYVSDYDFHGSISVYPPGETRPSRTIAAHFP